MVIGAPEHQARCAERHGAMRATRMEGNQRSNKVVRKTEDGKAN